MATGRAAAAVLAVLLATPPACVAVDPAQGPARGPDVGALLAGLDAPDPIGRERAFDGLVAAGGEARADIERARDAAADPDRKTELDRILKEIGWVSLPVVERPEDLPENAEKAAQAVGLLEGVASIPESPPLAPLALRTSLGMIPVSPGDLALPAVPGRAVRIRGRPRLLAREPGRPGSAETAWVLEAEAAEAVGEGEARGAARRLRGWRLARDPALVRERDGLLGAIRRFDLASYDPERAGRFRATLRRLLEVDDGASAATLAAVVQDPRTFDVYAYDAVGALAALGSVEARMLLREAGRTAARDGLRKRIDRALETGR